jgi:transcriptional regulator with XRE-family HTH domain
MSMNRKTYQSLADYLMRGGPPGPDGSRRIRQEDFAARVGVRQATISRIVRGLVVPRHDLAVRIAATARVPLDTFIRERNKRQAQNSQNSTQPQNGHAANK